jgi:hypothetical protein
MMISFNTSDGTVCRITNRGRVLEVIKAGRDQNYSLLVDGAPVTLSRDPVVTFRALAVYVDDEAGSKPDFSTTYGAEVSRTHGRNDDRDARVQ